MMGYGSCHGTGVRNDAADPRKPGEQRQVTIAVTRQESLGIFCPALVADEVGRAHSLHGTRARQQARRWTAGN